MSPGQTWSANRPEIEPNLFTSPGTFPSEPVFVPRPGATAEDDGVVVTVVLDVNGAEPASYLVVLDAVSFTEIARARAPHRIPFGLHGAFAPSATTPGAAT